jgi:hypothetical protein
LDPNAVVYDPDVPTDGAADETFRYPGVGPDAGEFDPDDPESEVLYPDEDLDDESWPAPDTRRKVKVTIPTLILSLLIIAAGAFWGGAVVDKHFGVKSTSSTSGLAAFSRSGAAGRFAGFGAEGGATTGGAATGAGGFGAGGFTTPAAEGTLTAVSGNTLTVKSTTGGSTVKVVMTSSTVVTRSGKGAPGTLTVGDTVRVIGTAKAGTVTATSITATAAGVTAATGGFGGGGGFGSAAGGSTTSSGGFGTSSSSGSSSGGFGS